MKIPANFISIGPHLEVQLHFGPLESQRRTHCANDRRFLMSLAAM